MNSTHNYLREILRLQSEGKLLPTGAPGCTEVAVSHDDWCMVFEGGICNCEPTVSPSKPNRAQRRARN